MTGRRFSTRETLQVGALAVGNGTALNVGGLSTLGIQVTIDGAAVVQFEGTVSGSPWGVVPMVDVSDGTDGHTSTSASGLFTGDVSGLSLFRARISSWTSDAVTVSALGTVAGT